MMNAVRCWRLQYTRFACSMPNHKGPIDPGYPLNPRAQLLMHQQLCCVAGSLVTACRGVQEIQLFAGEHLFSKTLLAEKTKTCGPVVNLLKCR